MKKRSLVLIFFLLISTVFAQDFQNSESLKIDIDVEGSIEVVPESSSYSIKSINVNLSFFPKDGFNQKVLEMNIEPDNEIIDDSIIFEWKNPYEKELSFGFNSRIKIYNKVVEVKDKLSFPIKELSAELEAYTKPSETIDSDDEQIVRLASSLVKGEDDLYEAVFKLAEWTKHNVKYDLSTLTAEVSQKASWVLENKEGVCDEITSLFIALCRAVGIPAKFASGVAYTNSELFEEGWGAHGWSEVYFLDYGWVPFDVTYGEFGFIDPTHVKMRESVDSVSSSTEYEWVSRNVDLKTKGLEIKTELVEEKGKVEEAIELKAEAIKKEAGLGSYNLIEVGVKNLKAHYAATEVYLSKTKSVEII
ncbi:MAG: transglutaminase domain-containing protein, partial [Nanoarchaeota archaeon]|nr:transglutaminase domain-containing protein [Nanoarchaeota archaeon]